MEIVALAIIGFVIYLALQSTETTTGATPTVRQRPESTLRQPGDQTFFAKLDPVVGDSGTPVAGVLLLKVRGLLQAPDATPAYLRVLMFDSELRESAHVCTQNKEQQANDGPAFLCTQLVGYKPGNRIYFEDWTSTGILVFIDSLIGPKGGDRTLYLDVEMRQTDDFSIWRTEVPFSASLDLGYQDADERLAANQVLSVQLAVAIASTSDGIQEVEIDAINSWIKTTTAELEPDERSKRRRNLVSTLRTSQQRSAAGTLQISKLITKLKSEGTKTGRMMAVELCFAVMAADGKASADELQTVNKIAEKLEVDPQLFNAARDKSLSGLSGSAVNTRDRYAILGIDASADPATIRTQLSALYKKWSSRATTLTDPAKRKEAEDMLRLIAEIRAEH
jgi:tellurite resistance protein